MCHNWSATYCTCARARVVPRSRERLNRLRSNLVQRWGPISRVACKSQLGPTSHVRTCRVTVPDLKNRWADCVQIWYMDRDRLVGCRASKLEAHPRSSARVELNLSLARLSPQKASYSLNMLADVYRVRKSPVIFLRFHKNMQPGQLYSIKPPNTDLPHLNTCFHSPSLSVCNPHQRR